MTGASLALTAISVYLSYEAQKKAEKQREQDALQQAQEAERLAQVAQERESRELGLQWEKTQYEAALAAEQAEWETTISLEKAEFTQGQIQEEMHRVHGAQVVGYAASGMDVSKGSPLQVMARTSQSAEAELRQVSRGHEIFAEVRKKEAAEVGRSGGLTYEWFTQRIHAETGYEVASREAEASMFRTQASAYGTQAQYTTYGQYLSTGSSLLGEYANM